MRSILPALSSTGIPGLDFILRGGLPCGNAYLLQGGPGTGKTTLALQFLLAGVDAGESALFITLAQSEEELHLIARSHGWTLANINIYEISRQTLIERLSTRQTVVHPADVELSEIVDRVREVISEHQPDRVVFDSIVIIRTLAGNLRNRYLEEMALLLDRVHKQGATALFLDEVLTQGQESALMSLAHGAIELSLDRQAYGADHRWVYVRKMRGHDFIMGQHNFIIRTSGLEVFPRLQKPKGEEEATTTITSGIDGLDNMLGGGMQTGTGCLLVGAAGTGKTSIATTYVHASLQRGDNAAIFLFDERRETFLMRSQALGMDIRPFLKSGQFGRYNYPLAQFRDGGTGTPGDYRGHQALWRSRAYHSRTQDFGGGYHDRQTTRSIYRCAQRPTQIRKRAEGAKGRNRIARQVEVSSRCIRGRAQ